MQYVTTLDHLVDLSGRTALVVGATAGIGASIAAQLASMNAMTVIVGRDAAKLKNSFDALSAIAPGHIHAQKADLADLKSIRIAANALSQAFPRIDLVIANASVQYSGKCRTFTVDGFESSFGINHLGNAALLLGLEGPIRAAGGRVVIVASEAHRRAKGLPMDDLMGDRSFDGVRAYNRSKLANILFARELAARWTNVTVFSAHPGGVLTDMLLRTVAGHLFFRVMFKLMRSQLLTADQAAAGIFRVAVDEVLEDSSGTYFELGRRAKSSALAMNDELGRQLYDATLRYLGQREPPPT